MTKQRSNTARVLAAITAAIDAGQLNVYRDRRGRPFVRCPGVCHDPSSTNCELHLCLRERDFRGWLSEFAWTKEGTLLRESALKSIIEVLVGMSLKTENHEDKQDVCTARHRALDSGKMGRVSGQSENRPDFSSARQADAQHNRVGKHHRPQLPQLFAFGAESQREDSAS